MSKQRQQQKIEEDYFKELTKKYDNPQSNQYVQMTSLISRSIYKIGNQIQSGQLSIDKKVFHIDQFVKLKRDKNRKDIEMLDRQILKNEELYKQTKRQLIQQKKQEMESIKEENQIKRKEVIEKVRKWTQLQKQLRQKREQLMIQREKKMAEEQQRIKKEEQDMSSFQKLEKKKLIEQRLKKIQQNKVRREQMMKNSVFLSHPLNPRFLQIQKKYRQFQQELKFQQQIYKKNHKISMKIDHQALKAHEKAFISRLEERNSNREGSPSQSSRRPSTQFERFLTKDKEKSAQQMKKLKRRRDFQQKLKQIPISIDESKKVEVEIAIDKSKNPLKYNFLGQKALNDFQIYGQFKDFDININPKEVGNGYLKELPTLIQNSRVEKSQSVRVLADREVIQRIKYKDYLQELKLNRSQKNEEQIQNIVRNHKQKNKAIEELSMRSKRYEYEAKKKSQEMQKYNGIKTKLKKSKQMDEMYMKSIKAKIACLQLNS